MGFFLDETRYSFRTLQFLFLYVKGQRLRKCVLDTVGVLFRVVFLLFDHSFRCVFKSSILVLRLNFFTFILSEGLGLYNFLRSSFLQWRADLRACQALQREKARVVQEVFLPEVLTGTKSK